MARNYHCNCLCHGADGNITDPYFACKNCYGANHMGNLPRQQADAPKAKTKGKAVPKPKRPTPEAIAAAVQKIAAKTIMNNIADAAQEIKNGKPILPQSSD